MALLITDGIYNNKIDNVLMQSSGGILLVSPLKVNTECPLGAYYWNINKDIVFNNHIYTDADFGRSGLVIKKCLSSVLLAATGFDATAQTITTPGDASGLSSGDVIHISGSKYNDGFYEVDSAVALEITVKAVPLIPSCLSGVVSDEVPVGSVIITVCNPSHIHWNNTIQSWMFGSIDTSGDFREFSMLGFKDSELTEAFSPINPNLSTAGASAITSGAFHVGVNLTGMISISETNVQGALAQLDTFASGAIPGIPALVYGETNVQGAPVNYIGIGATLAIFEDAVPEPINANIAATKGTLAKAARHDHIHEVMVDDPVALSGVNDQGTSASLSRADHQHSLDVVDGHIIKAGIIDLTDGTSSYIITFGTPYTTSIVSATVSLRSSASSSMYMADIIGLSTTQINVRFSSSIVGSSYKLHYIAVGN